eukprot:CAMPEP_0182873850 /NCGR_PEP_ID=MMETSP0034_2-20130328/12575_1 /TAXON_ID=156128 /ORGANISM="Nephroselmis pyriformis, Strain CCMP717" /LENGTH=644 /DNA_ID=CAMNT_0025006525 /DNA_START=37 /DNA_END=1971 /DNA_ORIENTATION=-
MAPAAMQSLQKLSYATMSSLRARNAPLASLIPASPEVVAGAGKTAPSGFALPRKGLDALTHGAVRARNVTTQASGARTVRALQSASQDILQSQDDYDFSRDFPEEHRMAPYPRVSMICTVGPASQDRIGDLVEAGMRIMRLNFSHGTHEYQTKLVNNLRNYLKGRDSNLSSDFTTGITVNCAVAFDLKGPEIRTGQNSSGGDIDIAVGQTVVLSLDEADKDSGRVEGDDVIIYVDYPKLPSAVSPGATVFLDDGLLNFEVSAVEEGRVVCKAVNAGKIGERKGVNLPGAILDLPAVSEKDKADLRLGAELGVDFIFASFVRKAEHVFEIRRILDEAGAPNCKIISKIENQEGLDNFDDILRATDGVMVARGDLGIEIPPEKVVTAQKRIIHKCNMVGKPVVCATQMLESMTNSPRPTRAEVSDVANAVLDGADCVMLSGETAKGKYPIEAIKVMGDICREADNLIDYHLLHERVRHHTKRHHRTVDSIAAAAVKCATDERAAMIVVVTHNGNAGRFVSKYRPPMPVLAVTTSEQVARQSFIHRGLTPLYVDQMSMDMCLVPLMSSVSEGDLEEPFGLDDPTVGAECGTSFKPGSSVPDEIIERSIEYGMSVNILKEGDTVVALVASTRAGASAMRVLTVGAVSD